MPSGCVGYDANAWDVVIGVIEELLVKCGDTDVSVRLTGSVDMGLSAKHSSTFVQEVVAAAKA